MNLIRLNVVLGVLLAIAATLAIAMNSDPTRPNVEFLPEMKRSPAFDAFAANPVLPHGRTLQAPGHGVIARGDLPLYYAATKEDAVRAGEELRNPFSDEVSDFAGDSDDTPQSDSDQRDRLGGATYQVNQLPTPKPAGAPGSIQRGAEVYGVFCVSCHGPGGAGDGPVTKRGFPPPPPLTTGKSVQMKDGQLFHILTYGQGSMSSMAAQLNRDRRWDVINYVRGMQQGAADQPTNAVGNNEQTPPADSGEEVNP